MTTTISFAKLLPTIDLPAALAEVGVLLTEEWVKHVNKADYQGGWDVLPLRCQRSHFDSHPILQGLAIEDGDEWTDLPALDRCPTLQAFVRRLRCEVKAVRLMRLMPAASIRPHRDAGLAMGFGEARLHVPLCGGADVEFIVNSKTVPMRDGELWYMNADHTHSVCNLGDQVRVNMVIDCEVNAWLQSQILEAVNR